MNLAAPGIKGGDARRFEQEMDQMGAAGINHLRIMAMSEGHGAFRMNPPVQPRAGEMDEALLMGLDRCLEGARRRAMRVTLVLGNTWHWSGGLPQLVDWASSLARPSSNHSSANQPHSTHKTEQSGIPYPISWNVSALPQRHDGFAGWGSWTRLGPDVRPYEEFMKYVASFFTNEKAQQMYRVNALAILNRRNAISGRLYKEDPTILAWEPLNEPQVTPRPTNQTWLGGHLPLAPSNLADPLLRWHRNTTMLIRQQAPSQLITTGFESKQGEWWFRQLHKDPNVDFACAHMWPQNWQWYDMLNDSQSNLDHAVRVSLQYLREIERWAQELGKPVLLEEFGMPRDNWLNAEQSYLYSSNISTSSRDRLFEQVLIQILDSFEHRKGWIGAIPWAYAGAYRPERQNLNKYGMLWAGDPPHEAPGWYSVYDTDEAMRLLKEQSKWTATSA
ncbi:hypothetical protein CBOM_05078 [Ceraceosorus bombacis]|uniref:mannan endo-1,4-beta-mannosidase n=1 Tax=Ceraceosorus bombacis TaxID=401625 RepID=A0A0P1BJI4_9BASI|nr:hypothetical protein CBOM_05078 [Ceraceosorus bombacis]